MGRGHDSDLRINDISVSRLHAMVKYKDGRFLLEDNMSKFGTLVLIKKKTPLIPGFNKAVQIGRTVVNFSVKNLSQYAHR
jgi:pSer/pThr/pTyr-binding forkhead associated (FHA) protein